MQAPELSFALLPFLAAVWVAGLAASLHCAAMCGPLVVMAAGAVPSTRAPVTGLAAAVGGHALGRLGAYLLLGAVAGTAGAALDVVGRAMHFARLAAFAAGIGMIAAGALALLRAVGGARWRWLGATRAAALPLVPLARLADRAPVSRGVFVGLLSAALPCGLLWAFVAAAAGVGDPVGGALTMAAFWLGGVPALSAAGFGAGALVRRLGPRAPLAAALALLVAGASAIAWRAPSFHAAAVPTASAGGEEPCH